MKRRRKRRRLLNWERTTRLAAGRDKNSSHWQDIFKCASANAFQKRRHKKCDSAATKALLLTAESNETDGAKRQKLIVAPVIFAG